MAPEPCPPPHPPTQICAPEAPAHERAQLESDRFDFLSRSAPGLTSEVSEVDGLPVGVEQLDDGVVIILHSAADGGRFALDHGHVVSRQVLPLHCGENTRTTWGGGCFIELRHQISTDSQIF